MSEQLTAEWLERHGFIRDELLGYRRWLSNGPGDSVFDLVVGHYPFNSFCVALVVGGFGAVTNAETTDDILALIRLLDGAEIDHPDVAEIDFDDGE